MSSIDNRIVQMQFDNDQFERGVERTLGSIGQLDNSINGLTKTDFATTLGNNIQAISDKFSMLGLIGMEAMHRISEAVVDTGIKMAESLSVDQWREGFSKYESSVKNVGAILNQSVEGTTIEDVEDVINALTWYSDMTSYSSEAMSLALSNFVSQGIDMKEAIPAIMGIGNSLSYAGLAAEEASSAFDIYSRAIGQGYMSLMQWRRLQAMKGATVGLKKQYLEAAVAEETLIKVSDDLYETTSGLEVTVETFDSTLGNPKGKWMTREVMLRVLSGEYGNLAHKIQEFADNYEKENGVVLTATEAEEKYAESLGLTIDQLDELGLKSFDAAMKARTFTEAINAVKDASSTGWKKIFQNVFGNYEEATAMWTSFGDYINGIFTAPISALEKLTGDWKLNHGYLAMQKAFVNLSKVLESIVTPIKEAFTDIIPPLIGRKLSELTFEIMKFLRYASISEETSDKLKRAFSGLFAVVDILRIALGRVFEVLGTIWDITAPLRSSFLDLAAGFGDWLVSVRDYISENPKLSSALIKAAESFGKLGESFHPFQTLFGWFTSAFETFSTFISDTCEDIKASFDLALGEGIGFQSIIDALVKIWGLMAVGNAYEMFAKGFGFLTDIFGTFGDFLDSIEDAISSFASGNYAKALKDVAIAIGILAVSVLLLASIDVDKLGNAFAFLTGVIIELSAALAVINKIFSSGSVASGKGPFGFLQGLSKGRNVAVASTSMIALASSILILAGSLKILSTIDTNKLFPLIVALGGMMYAVSVFANLMKDAKVGMGTSIAIMGIATALLMMTGAMKILETIKMSDLDNYLFIIGGLLAEIAAFSKMLTDSQINVGTGAAILLVSVALIAFVGAIKMLSSIGFTNIGKGLLTIGVALYGLGFGLKQAGENALANGASLMLAALAIDLLALALAKMETIDPETFGPSLVVLGLALAGLVYALNSMTGTIAGSAALLLAAVAINAITIALGLMGILPIEVIGKGLLGLAGGMLIFGTAAAVLTPLAPGMLALSASMVAFGAACIVLGAGIAAVSGGVILAVVAIREVLTGLYDFIVFIVTGIGNFLEWLGGIIINSCTWIFNYFKENGVPFVTWIEKFVGKVAETIFNGVGSIIDWLWDHGKEAFTKFLDGCKEKFSDIGPTMEEFSSDITGGLKDLASDLFNKGVNAIQGFINGLKSKKKDVQDASADVGNAAKNGTANALDIRSPSRVFARLGGYVDQGLINGMLDGADSVSRAGEKIGNNLYDAVSDSIGNVNNLIDDPTFDPTITPVLDLSNVQNGLSYLDNSFGDVPYGMNFTGTVQTDDATIRNVVDELNSLKSLFTQYQAANDPETMASMFARAIEGMSITMDGNKVGKIVTTYQNQNRRAYGV